METQAVQMETLNPGPVFDMLLAYQRTAALRAAIELEIFRWIGEGVADVEGLAGRCSASPRGIRILCDFLAVNGVLLKKDGNYSHTSLSGAFLDPKSPMCIASISRFLGNMEMSRPFENLADIVRNGRTSLPGDGSVEPDHPIWVEFARSMAPMMAPMAPPLAALTLEGLSGDIRVLDIAAGHGLFGIEIAKQAPRARVVAQDWGHVLEVAKENARAAGVADRYETLPGSAFDVEYGDAYDAALLTNFLHHFDQPTCIGLLKKVRAAMRPGGKAVTLDFVPNDDRVSPPMAAGFAMTMLGTTPAGDAYTFRELEDMYREAGFGTISMHPVPTGPNTVVIGRAV